MKVIEPIRLEGVIPEESSGWRVDQALAAMFPAYSRARLTTWIKEGGVALDGRTPKPKERVAGGESVRIEAVLESEGEWKAEPIPLTVVYEDDDLLVIDKPAGLVVHPAVGNRAGTLLNALLHHAPELDRVPRAGIVHRLDKETSGLLVVARNLESQNALVRQLQEREVSREYIAVVGGVMTGGGTVEAPIGRHPVDRKRMAVVGGGKPAVTHYRVLERYRAHTLVSVRLETGRTHQIRVHMAHIRYPIIGDPVYGGRPRLPAGTDSALREMIQGFRRQALHAARLGLIHPRSGEALAWESPLPADIEGLIAALREDAGE